MPKIFTSQFKEDAVRYYEKGHTVDETTREFCISESSLYAWKKEYDATHQLIIRKPSEVKTFRQKQLHSQKVDQMIEVLRESHCRLDATTDEKMAIIEKMEGRYSVHVLCEALGLPRGTYYNRKRQEDKKYRYQEDDEKVKPLIKEIFEESKCRFGRKPIHHILLEKGIHFSEKRVARLMGEMGLQVERPQYMAEHLKPIPRSYFKDQLRQDFSQKAPNLVWVSDITYIKVGNQYCYLCVVIDLFSRSVLAYGLSENIDTTLTLTTFKAAYKTRGKPDGLMFHTDQGMQYTAYTFRRYLRTVSVKQSFSHPGSPHDNSVCESFFHTMKKEAIYHHLYDNMEELRSAVDEYIDFYNNNRPHRKLNMMTPSNFESEFEKSLAE